MCTSRTAKVFKDKAFNSNRIIFCLCGKPILNRQDATVDHIIPKSWGGKDHRNMRLMHSRCNNRRGIVTTEIKDKYFHRDRENMLHVSTRARTALNELIKQERVIEAKHLAGEALFLAFAQWDDQ